MYSTNLMYTKYFSLPWSWKKIRKIPELKEWANHATNKLSSSYVYINTKRNERQWKKIFWLYFSTSIFKYGNVSTLKIDQWRISFFFFWCPRFLANVFFLLPEYAKIKLRYYCPKKKHDYDDLLCFERLEMSVSSNGGVTEE